MAIVTVLSQLLLQRFDVLLLQAALLFQHADVLVLAIDKFPLQAHLLSQQAILLSKMDQFFFCCHACTLQGVGSFGKPVGDLSSYEQETFYPTSALSIAQVEPFFSFRFD